jgi:hypothetical protein
MQFTNLKIKFFFLITLLFSVIYFSSAQTCDNPTVYENRLNVVLNYANNSFDIHGLTCDICVFGSIANAAKCNCHVNCEVQKEACIDACAESSNTIAELIACVDDCNIIEGACKNNCGEIPARVREPVDYFFTYRFWWSTACTSTMAGTPNQVGTSSWISGAPPDPLSIDLLTDLTMMSVSYCYFTQIVVVYDDDTCCIFVDSGCADIC